MRLIDADKLIYNIDLTIFYDDSSDVALGKVYAIQEIGRMAVEEEVKAISIKWIKSKIDAILDSYPNGNEETEILCKLLYDWEKEK